MNKSRNKSEKASAPETRTTVCVGWDGQSKPILRYRDELDLPEHQQTRVSAKAEAAQ